MHRNEEYDQMKVVLPKEAQDNPNYNKTTNYMLKALELPMPFKMLKYHNFIDCYIGDAENKTVFHDNCLFVLFNPFKIDVNWREFENILKTYPNYVTSYDVDINKVMIVFKVHDKWATSLKEFKRSRYSKVDRAYIEKYFHPLMGPDNKKSICHAVLTKADWYKKQLEEQLDVELDENAELGSLLNLEDEIYRYKQ